MSLKPKLPSGIYGVTSGDFGYTQEQSAIHLLKAGIKIIQYREKNAATRLMFKEAIRIKQLCRQYGALFIVNDRIDIALAADADGVHIGQDDMLIEIVKKYLSDKIIGVSVRNAAEVLSVQRAGADYLGAGAVYPTSTKQDSICIRPDGLAAIVGASDIPVYAIGGITKDNISELRQYNIYGAAVISAILNTPDPEKTAREFIHIWNSNY